MSKLELALRRSLTSHYQQACILDEVICACICGVLSTKIHAPNSVSASSKCFLNYYATPLTTLDIHKFLYKRVWDVSMRCQYIGYKGFWFLANISWLELTPERFPPGRDISPTEIFMDERRD